jgi:hypothetical protein
MPKFLQLGLLACALVALPNCESQPLPVPSARVIELTADRDSRYRQGRRASPVIEVFTNEPLILHITATRAHEVARDGSIHGLALLDKDLKTVAGWSFLLHPGVQDLAVNAPDKPGRYTAVCTVICSEGHDGMEFTLLVSNATRSAPTSSAKESK